MVMRVLAEEARLVLTVEGERVWRMMVRAW